MQAWISFLWLLMFWLLFWYQVRKLLKLLSCLLWKKVCWYGNYLRKDVIVFKELFTLQFLLKNNCKSSFVAGHYNITFLCWLWCSSCCNKVIIEGREWWKTRCCKSICLLPISIEPLLHFLILYYHSLLRLIWFRLCIRFL